MPEFITIKQAREYFELGAIAGFAVVRVPMSDGGWAVTANGRTGASWTLRTARGDMRVFATLDAAVRAVEEVGGSVSALSVVA